MKQQTVNKPEDMPQPKPEHYFTPIAGIHFVTGKAHSYSPTYEVRDKNMRRTLASNYKPFTYEVPFGGSAWEVVYDCEQDMFLTYDEISGLEELIAKNS